MRRGLLLVLGSWLCAACELTEVTLAEPEDLVVVELVLRAWQPVQTALVHRSLGLGRPPAATIDVRDEQGGRFRFDSASDGDCMISTFEPDGSSRCYTWRGGPAGSFVKAGARYTLDVTTADGRTLTGETRVPGEFNLVQPSVPRCQVEPGQTIELIWTQADDVWAYISETRISGLSDAFEPLGIPVVDPLRLVGLSISREDTTIVLPAEFGLFNRFDSDLSEALVALQAGLPPEAMAYVVIGAADRNYVNWERGGNFNPSGTVRVPSVHGAGGTGLFGSVVPREVSVSTRTGMVAPEC